MLLVGWHAPPPVHARTSRAASAGRHGARGQQTCREPRQSGWDFDDEEEDAPTWADDIRAQALDIAMLAAFSVLAFVSFFRKSVRAQVRRRSSRRSLYLGFYKSQLISIVNVFGLFGGNLPVFRYNLAWYLLAAVTRRLDGAVGPGLLRTASARLAR